MGIRPNDDRVALYVRVPVEYHTVLRVEAARQRKKVADLVVDLLTPFVEAHPLTSGGPK
jgi:predicted HicB family RNase H-like nuclease